MGSISGAVSFRSRRLLEDDRTHIVEGVNTDAVAPLQAIRTQAGDQFSNRVPGGLLGHKPRDVGRIDENLSSISTVLLTSFVPTFKLTGTSSL